jgi:5-amino-6-(5-phosphoribosylamino)uracil reductase
MTFQEYSARKIADATSATIPGFRTEFDRAPGVMLAIGNSWSRGLFDGAFYLSPLPSSARPACSLVFVQSRDGNTGAKNPATLGGGDTDKHLVYEGLTRVAADAVLAGADTIRGGDVLFSVWHPELVSLRASLGKPRHPAQIVATLRGLDVEHALFFNVPDVPVFVVTVGHCADAMAVAIGARPWINLVVMDEPADLPLAMEALRARGIERISAVGGRRLAAQLLDAGLVQDVYLTTAAKDGGEPNTPMYGKPLDMDVIVRKHARGTEAGVVFEHFVGSGFLVPGS